MARVLVIADCPDFRVWARCVLKRDGLEVIDARDVLAGLQRAVEDAPDLILISSDLAASKSLEMGELLARDPATRSVPAFVVGDEDETSGHRGSPPTPIPPETLPLVHADELTLRVRAILWDQSVPWMSIAHGLSGSGPAARQRGRV